jgi:hypothetical protein
MRMRYQDKDESEIPDALLNEPELLQGLSIYYDAFWEVFPDRQLGMSVGPIPYSSIVTYSKEWNLDEEMSATMLRLVRKMDNAFLEWQEKQSKKNSKIKGSSNG